MRDSFIFFSFALLKCKGMSDQDPVALLVMTTCNDSGAHSIAVLLTPLPPKKKTNTAKRNGAEKKRPHH